MANKRQCNNDCIFQCSGFLEHLKQKINNFNFLGNFKCYFVTLNGALKQFSKLQYIHLGQQTRRDWVQNLLLSFKSSAKIPVTHTSKPLWAEEQTPSELELEKHTPTYTKRWARISAVILQIDFREKQNLSATNHWSTYFSFLSQDPFHIHQFKYHYHQETELWSLLERFR